jgi:hypothetical protein
MNWEGFRGNRVAVEVLPWYVPGGPEEKGENLCQDDRCCDLNPTSPKYKFDQLVF